jgi:hypothetical protein
MNQDETPDPITDDTQPLLVCGATTLNRVAKERNWRPGTFLNDNFDFEIWRDGYGADCVLNGDARVCTIGEAHTLDVTEDVFVRPTDDSKAFTGQTMDAEQFKIWYNHINKLSDIQKGNGPRSDTQIVVSSVKNIKAEYRFFVVNRTVVTGSMYKLGNTVMSSSRIDEHVRRFADEMTFHWEPADAYVIDVAETDQGMKVVEINNINSAGFYDCDVQKIVMAIEDLVKYGRTKHTNVL